MVRKMNLWHARYVLKSTRHLTFKNCSNPNSCLPSDGPLRTQKSHSTDLPFIVTVKCGTCLQVCSGVFMVMAMPVKEPCANFGLLPICCSCKRVDQDWKETRLPKSRLSLQPCWPSNQRLQISSFRIGVWYQNCGSLGWMQIESALHVKVTRNNSGKHLFGVSLDTVQWMLVI